MWTTYKSSDLAHSRIRSLVAWHSLDTTLLDTELARSSLKLSIDAVASNELGFVNRILVTNIADCGIWLCEFLPTSCLKILLHGHGEARSSCLGLQLNLGK